MKISDKDIKSFAKVLIKIGEILQENPQILTQLIEKESPDKPDNELSKEEQEKLESIKIFEITREKNKDEIMNLFKEYNDKELRYIINFNNMGSSKAKSVQTLSEYIANFITKRTTDVFRDHE